MFAVVVVLAGLLRLVRGFRRLAEKMNSNEDGRSEEAKEEGRGRKFETLLRQKQSRAEHRGLRSAFAAAKVRVTGCSFLKESIFVPLYGFPY